MFSLNKCHKIMQYEMKKWGLFSPRNTRFQQSMPTRRSAALYFKLNFPPKIQNQILMKMNTHRETKIIHKNVYIAG